jgi:hypothetical protein
MSNSITNSLPSFNPYNQPANGYRAESFQQTSENQKDSQISLTTAEGDVVTISSSYAKAMAYAASEEFAPGMWSQSSTAMSLESSTFNMSIQGDLNEEELQDIKHLLQDLKKIAKSFFHGDTQGAMNKALNIGDMGSVTQLSASFSYSQQISTTHSIATYQPLPAGDMPATFKDPQEIIGEDSAEDFNFADILKARWQQMLKTFDSDDEKDDVIDEMKTANEDNNTPVAEQMLARVLETIEKQPQLSPFVIPVANLAIDEAAASVSEIKDQNINPNQLHKNFLNQWKNWMLT